MKRRNWLASILAWPALLRSQTLGPRTLGGRKPDPGGKYYITGFFHNKAFNDCTVPPLVTSGKDRVDALLRCCAEGGLTVWTEDEWKDFQERLGAQFSKGCEAMKGLDK